MSTVDVYQLWLERLVTQRHRTRSRNVYLMGIFDDQVGEQYLYVQSHPVRIRPKLRGSRDAVLFSFQRPFSDGTMLYTTLAPEDGTATLPAQVGFRILLLHDRSDSRNTGKALRELFDDTDLDSVAEAVEALAREAEEDGDAAEPDSEVDVAAFSSRGPAEARETRGFRTGPVFIYEEVPQEFAPGIIPAATFTSANVVLAAKVVGIIVRVTPVIIRTIGTILENRSDQVLASFTGTKQVTAVGGDPDEFDVVADSPGQRSSMQGRWEWRAVPAGSIRRIPVVKSKAEEPVPAGPASDDP